MTESEKPFQNARRSLVAKKAIKEGEKLTFENTTTKRPAISDCIGAGDFFNILEGGNVFASRVLEEDRILLWSDVVVRDVSK